MSQGWMSWLSDHQPSLQLQGCCTLKVSPPLLRLLLQVSLAWMMKPISSPKTHCSQAQTGSAHTSTMVQLRQDQHTQALQASPHTISPTQALTTPRSSQNNHAHCQGPFLLDLYTRLKTWRPALGAQPRGHRPSDCFLTAAQHLR